MDNPAREEEWASWMRSANTGDSQAYHRLLSVMTPRLRMMVRRRCALFGAPTSETEDVMQVVLLSIDLKRASWDPSRPLCPWLSAIVRNKLIDSMRRRGRQIRVPLEDVLNTLESNQSKASDRRDVERVLNSLKDPQRTIVQSISLEGASGRETTERLNMTEVAVRVALHKALKALSALSSERTT